MVHFGESDSVPTLICFDAGGVVFNAKEYKMKA